MLICEGEAGGDYYALMTEAMHKLLLEREVLAPDDVDSLIADLTLPSAAWGARVVARAWLDPAFKARLLADGRAGCGELGYPVREA